MHVVIAGLGLIGGSLGKALRRAGWRVGFIDPAVPLEEAKAAGAAGENAEGLDADLVVLATPANVALSMLASLRGSANVITSVASVMAPLREAASDVNFVAGHPFAGSELRGLAAARADLFTAKPWFVDRDDALVNRMIEAAGAERLVVDPGEHDRVMAVTSHLPQVIATALGSMFDGMDPRLIGSGARSMLRLAGSAWEVWQPILELNDANISGAVEELWQVLRRIGAEEFDRAQRTYRELSGK